MADLWKQVERAAELVESVRTACQEGLDLLDGMAHVAASGGVSLAMVDRAWDEAVDPWETWRADTILQQVPTRYGGKYQRGAYLLPLGPVPLRIHMPTLLAYTSSWDRLDYVEDARQGLHRTLDSLRLLEIQVESARQEAEQLV